MKVMIPLLFCTKQKLRKVWRLAGRENNIGDTHIKAAKDDFIVLWILSDQPQKVAKQLENRASKETQRGTQ